MVKLPLGRPAVAGQPSRSGRWSGQCWLDGLSVADGGEVDERRHVEPVDLIGGRPEREAGLAGTARTCGEQSHRLRSMRSRISRNSVSRQ